jgi:predicted transcriptional regulator
MDKNALRAYFDENCITVNKFCIREGLNKASVYKILKGKDIYLSQALKIEKATNRKVKCQDLIPISPPHKRGRKPYKNLEKEEIQK